MPSQLQDTNLDSIDWDSLSNEQLEDLAANDDRTTAQDKAKALLEERLKPAPVLDLGDYNPRNDPGPPRPEDTDVEDDTPTSSPEVPLEESRKDDTTVLATDQFDNEGHRIN